MAFLASADPDIMYLQQAMKKPDKQEIIKVMLQKNA
jgi:hypothetical protein